MIPVSIYRWSDGTEAQIFTGEFSEWKVLVCGRGTFRVELRFSIAGPPKLVLEAPRVNVFDRQIVGFHLGRQVLGLAIDLGVEHPFTQGPGLFLTGRTPSTTMPYPRWIDEDRWERRYEEAAQRVSPAWVYKGPPQMREALEKLEPFLGVYPRFVLGPESSAPRRWFATYDGHAPVEGWSFEEVVDAFTSQELLLPASARGAWEAANAERGEFLLPSLDDVEVFRILGEPLPFFWGKARFEAWLSEREAP